MGHWYGKYKFFHSNPLFSWPSWEGIDVGGCEGGDNGSCKGGQGEIDFVLFEGFRFLTDGDFGDCKVKKHFSDRVLSPMKANDIKR